MKIHDALANFSSTLQNCIINNKHNIVIPYTTLVLELTQLFYKEGYFISYKILTIESKLYIYAIIKKKDGLFCIHKIKKISLQSQKKYISLIKLKKYYKFINGDTNYIISTPNGVFSGKTCILYGISGEIIFKIN